MNDVWIIYCKTDGRFIALAQNEAHALQVYHALAETTVLDEHYEIERLEFYLRSMGFQADTWLEKFNARS